MKSQAIACINPAALQHNLRQVRQAAPDASVMAVIKADAYGHGIEVAASALSTADAFAVGTVNEAQRLRRINTDKPILVLQGADSIESLVICADLHLDIVLHSNYQAELLSRFHADEAINVWVKVDTGMHRLGIPPESFTGIIERLNQCRAVNKPAGLMSHLACADEPERGENVRQFAEFSALRTIHDGPCSICNSAAIIAFPERQYDWVRPGIMLYGISPLYQRSAEELGLLPVMTLKSRLIAINELKKGDAIGYGATWACPEDMRVGVVGIGYGDGYPRHAPSGTPVLIRGERVPIVGRVSMDMITVDLRMLDAASIGDEVVLWGEGLPIEIIADQADTIGYELVCRLTSRVRFEVVADA